MPKDIVDIFKNFWNFFKRFIRDLYTLLKFRGHELDERLQVRYPTSIRALVWLAIALTSIGLIILVLSLLSNFAFKAIHLDNSPFQKAPTPTITPLP